VPCIHVYGSRVDAADDNSSSHTPSIASQLGKELEACTASPRVRIVQCVKDHALPIRKARTPGEYESYLPPSILKRGWTQKHQEMIPGCVIVTVEVVSLTAQAEREACERYERVRANFTASGRPNLPAALVVLCEVDSDPLKWADRVRLFVTTLKRSLQRSSGIFSQTSGTASTSTNNNNNNNNNNLLLHRGEEAKRVPPCVIAVFSRQDIESPDTLVKFRAQILEAALEWYRSDIARIKVRFFVFIRLIIRKGSTFVIRL